MRRRMWAAALLLSAASIAGAGVPPFQLHDTEGGVHTPAEWRGQKAILLFFVSTDCPVGNSYVPELNRIRADYSGRGVLVFAVQAETATPDAEVIKYAKDYHYTFPLLFDRKQVLVQFTGAHVTPQAAVISPEGKVMYLGRIDNRVEDFGKTRFQATERDVRDALDAVLAGRPVPHPTTKSIGCAINLVK